jgi:hypothetical protein
MPAASSFWCKGIKVAAGREIPGLNFDFVPSLLELPGNPFRPHPISAGVADEEVRLRGFWHSVSLSAPDFQDNLLTAP